MEDNDMSLGFIAGLIKSISTKIAVQYAAVGITGVEANADALVFHFTPPTPDSVVPYTHIMAVAKYVNENGTGSVRNANKLNEQTADFYTSATNINYSNTTSGLQSTTVQNAIGEIVNMLATQLAKIITNETDIQALQTSVTQLNTESSDHNTAIQNIIKGDFVSSSGYIGLDKDVSGIVINSDIIDSMLDSHENSIGSMNVDITTNSTNISNNHNEVLSHFTSNTPHSGVLERVVNKGVANGYAPLNSDGKVPSQHLVLPMSYTSYLLTESSTVTDPSTGIPYKQRCASITDPRYGNTTQTLNKTIASDVGVWGVILGSVTDPVLTTQTINNLLSMTALVVSVPSGTAAIASRIDYYKRSGTTETLLGSSTENILRLTTSPSTYYFNTQLSSFSLNNGDRLVLKVLMKKSLPTPIETQISVEGINGTSTIFSGMGINGGGGSETVSVNDVVGLPQIFNGTTEIDDIKLSGKPYKLSDFMEIAQMGATDTFYVSSSSLNGTGERFTPFGNLQQVFTAIDSGVFKPNIEILSGGQYSLPNTYTTANIELFSATKSRLIGNLMVSMENSIYEILELEGNLTINAANSIVKITRMSGGSIVINANCILLIEGSFTGVITILNGNLPYVKINRILTSMPTQDILDLPVANGSLIGQHSFGVGLFIKS